MNISRIHVEAFALALVLGLAQMACNARTPKTDDAAPAPVDTAAQDRDTSTAPPAATPQPTEPDTSMATPPITPPEPQRDTPPAGAAKPAKPAQQETGGALKVSAAEYEGWRQYSVNCARCHGQDVLPNPVAANLLISLGPGGPIDTPEKFSQVVTNGRPERGMPAFKGVVTPDQINAMYAYVEARAEKRIPAGRPDRPQT